MQAFEDIKNLAIQTKHTLHQKAADSTVLDLIEQRTIMKELDAPPGRNSMMDSRTVKRQDSTEFLQRNLKQWKWIVNAANMYLTF